MFDIRIARFCSAPIIALRWLLLVSFATVFPVSVFSSDQTQKSELSSGFPTPTQIRRLPMTIAASCTGNTSQGHSWYLSINSRGEGSLVITTFPEHTIEQVNVCQAQLNDVKRSIIENGFFKLKKRQGQTVPCGNTRTVTIVVGQYAKTIQIDFINDSTLDGTDSAPDESTRALRVQAVIRSLFSNSEAARIGKK